MMIADQTGPLRNIDARVKLTWLLATFVCGIVFTNILSLVVILASIVMVALIGKVFREVMINLKSMWFSIIIIGLIFSLTVGGETLFYLLPPGLPVIGGHLPVSREGLQLGIVSVLRMFVFVIPVVMMVMTTSNSDMLRALMFVRLPMEFALMIVLALNFVPLYIEELARIADAQRARAHSLMDKGLLGKMRGMVPLFVPLTLNVVDRADTVGKVLEIRGFSKGQFSIDFEPLSISDLLFLVYCLGLLALALASLVLKTDLIVAAWQTVWA
ncbi:MAG TPA: energy-coupling factor transporter transmembrane component T [Anaerolineae bacterium]|jgi:energy-coupling factor transport system permease protein|nr:energy-coupling factor transporter transmembrane component T [Anaerolineae bacterium]